MPDDILQQERDAAKRLLALLEEARRDVRARLVAVDAGSYAAAVLPQIQRSLGAAIGHLQAQMEQALAASRAETIRAGAAQAARALPQIEGLVPFALPPSLLGTLADYHAGLVQSVCAELQQGITRGVQLGMLAGQSIPEIATNLTAVRRVSGEGLRPIGPFKTARDRALAIAVTETNRVGNMAIFARGEDAATRTPGLLKEWRTAEDARVRPSHAALNGVRLPMDGLFDVGGHKAKHPLDPALPASETVHCRCRLVFVVPEE